MAEKLDWTFGSDPEFMIAEADRTFWEKSAITVIGHGKDNPIDLGDGQFAYYDNVLLEGQIAPAKSLEAFLANFKSWFDDVKEILGRDLIIKTQAYASYPANEVAHKKAKEAGCDPEFTIWETQEVDGQVGYKRIIHPGFKESTNRTAGGHIHVGHPLVNVFEGGEPDRFVRMADLFLGNTAILISHDVTERQRRNYYGGAGYHRTPDYGVEYRTLSNFWLESPTLVEIIYDLTGVCLALVAEDLDREIWASLDDPSDLKATINNHSLTGARKYWEVCKGYLDQGFQSLIEAHFVNQRYSMYESWKEISVEDKAKAA